MSELIFDFQRSHSEKENKFQVEQRVPITN